MARRNALRLAKDARTLLAMQRFPSAALLAAMAIEEESKVSAACAIACSQERHRRSAWKEYRDHNAKSSTWGLDKIEPSPDLLVRALRLMEHVEKGSDLNAIKQTSVYVDCYDAGVWSDPEAEIDGDLARRLVELAEQYCRTAERYSPRDIELWVQHMTAAGLENPVEKILKWHEAAVAEGLLGLGKHSLETYLAMRERAAGSSTATDNAP